MANIPKVAGQVDLAHLGENFSTKSQAADSLEVEATSQDISDAQVEMYNLDAIKKRIIVLCYERIVAALLSKGISLLEKANLALKGVALIEGTRKVIEWDKRAVDDKDLLAKAEKLGKQITELSKKMPPMELAKFQAKAVDSIVKSLTDGEPN